MTSNGCRRGEAPKIVQIETRYVETDAINFRDVVQSLTGKNSSTTWIGRNAGSSVFVAGSEMKRGGIAHRDHHGVIANKPKEEDVTSNNNGGNDSSLISSMVVKNVSFKDFDTLLSELPPMEGLPWLYFEPNFQLNN